ncbi:MAG: InlB B-repeat-containing protein, partial [Clostridia bacterium]|nr:InlB B-repeat-containing protein [Clostridia bacterium]
VLPQSGDLSGVTNTAENPAQYTTQESVLLQAPENVPVGYLFDGWYAESDTQKKNKITDLKNCTGDLRLAANFVKGFSLTVETTETLVTAWKEGDAPFALVAPAISGKTFVKWQTRVGDAFVDYTGETTFIPVNNMHFKAVYVETTYTVTYVADGATHTNAQTYSAQSPLTFAKAEKAGSVFCGWYTDEALTNRIESSQGLTENLTVYAGFIDGGEVAGKATVSSKAQALPMLVLPSGCWYAVQLFEKGSETPLTLAESNTYVFSEAGKEYVVSYTATSPYGESVVKKIVLTVENEQVITDITPEPPASNDNENGKLVWIIVGVVAGVLVVGGGVLLVCKKRGDDEE